jgi:hypothetical protein
MKMPYCAIVYVSKQEDPLSVPVPLFRRAVPLLDHVIQKMWNSSIFSLKKSGTVPLFLELSHFVSVFFDTAQKFANDFDVLKRFPI